MPRHPLAGDDDLVEVFLGCGPASAAVAAVATIQANATVSSSNPSGNTLPLVDQLNCQRSMMREGRPSRLGSR